MNQVMEIPVQEEDVIRLFAIDLPESEIEAFSIPYYTEGNELHWPLKSALGAITLEEDHIEVFPISNLEGLGLAGYLIEGNEVPQDQVEPMRNQLEQLKGYVMLVFSPAFEGMGQALHPKSPLRHIATFYLHGMPVSFTPLPEESAKLGSGNDQIAPPKKAPSQAAMMGRVATFALLFLFALTALIIWIGS